jgi:hypothetical protein
VTVTAGAAGACHAALSAAGAAGRGSAAFEYLVIHRHTRVVVGCQQKYSVTFTQPANSVQAGLYQFVVSINHSPQGATTPPPLDQQLTENVGFAQSSPVKFTPTVDESN